MKTEKVKDPQDLILAAIEDPKAAKILAEIWEQIQEEPMAAARMVRAFSAARSAISETVKDLPEMWEKLDAFITKAELRRTAFLNDIQGFRSETTREIAGAIGDMEKVMAFFDRINDNTFMNKANRVLDLCNRLASAKEDGTLDVLARLVAPTPGQSTPAPQNGAGQYRPNTPPKFTGR